MGLIDTTTLSPAVLAQPEAAATIRRRLGLSSPVASLSLYASVDAAYDTIDEELTALSKYRALILEFCDYAKEDPPDMPDVKYMLLVAMLMPDRYHALVDKMEEIVARYLPRMSVE